ncbi:hypothetical protein Bbelb_285310 [Branchiostoma belcheri]|nr:hypothetical protein Bbelb_285310 [Branchiostoma belcheri]
MAEQKHGVETDRSRVTTLQFQAQNVVLQTVLHLGQTSPYQSGSIRAQLASGAYGVLCSSIREKLVSDFPLMVTDELLWLLVPPHTKNLDLSRCHSLRSLTLADLGPDCHMTFDLCSIPQACPHLTFLNLASSEVDDWVVWAALRLWPHLSHLDLSYCNNLTDDWCRLASVDISGCVYLTTKSIRHLTELCGPTLQALNMGFTGVDCSALWFLCGYSLFTAVQLAVAVDNNQVTGGNQGACPPMQDNRLLSPDLIHKILAGELHHGNQQPITIGLVDEEREGESSRERAMRLVSSGGQDALKQGTEMVSNNSMTPLDSANRNLRKLSLTWKDIRDETVEFIGQHAKDLRYLSMIDCDRTSPFSLACLAQNCNKLEYLDVKGMSFIGDAGLIPLVVNNRQLQTLTLAECNITDRALHKISGCLGEGEITDSGLSGVVGACVNLQQLSLRQCLSTAHTLVRLGENCRQLRSLMMSGVEGMSDGVLVSMVETLGLLEELDVSWNLGLTDVSICRVLVCCPRLRDARLAGLKRITSKPFLPIISDLARWRRCQSLLKLKEKERRVFEEEGEETWSSDEEFEDLYIPHRSASYAPCLRDLDLEYSDSVNDDYLAEIVAVCHGTHLLQNF